jgi:hypothetical protein
LECGIGHHGDVCRQNRLQPEADGIEAGRARRIDLLQR